MTIYKVNMYLGLKAGLVENKFGALYSTTLIESDTELTEDEIRKKYYEKIRICPRTHYIEITKL